MRPMSNPMTAHGGNTLTALPPRILDLGILAVVFVAPLFMGGRGPIGKFVFISIVCLTAMAWAISRVPGSAPPD